LKKKENFKSQQNQKKNLSLSWFNWIKITIICVKESLKRIFTRILAIYSSFKIDKMQDGIITNKF
jgi:hypothetical protein